MISQRKKDAKNENISNGPSHLLLKINSMIQKAKNIKGMDELKRDSFTYNSTLICIILNRRKRKDIKKLKMDSSPSSARQN